MAWGDNFYSGLDSMTLEKWDWDAQNWDGSFEHDDDGNEYDEDEELEG